MSKGAGVSEGAALKRANINYTTTKKGGKTTYHVNKNDEADAQAAMKNDPKYIVGKTRVQSEDIVNEISSRTLSNYIKKGTQDVAKRASDPDSHSGPKYGKKMNRMDGVMKAADKLAKKAGKNEEVIPEAKVDAGKSPEGKEAARNKRKFGTSHNQAKTSATTSYLMKRPS